MKIEKSVILAPNKEVDLKELTYPLYGSYKLDGIRCLIKEGKLLSRSGKPLPNKNLKDRFQSLLKEKHHVYDGELYVKSKEFRDISAIVMAHDAPLEDIELHVFDIMTLKEWKTDNPNSYSYRYGYLEKDYELIGSPQYVKIVKQKRISSADKAQAMFDIAIEKGYEGIILRSPIGLYKHGRCTIKEANLFKVKAWQDYDGMIISVHEGKRIKDDAPKETSELGKTKRSLKQEYYEPSGSFGFFTVEVKDDDNKTISTVEIGSWKGITDELRDEIWKNKKKYIGRWVRFKGMAVGVKDKPRMPKDMEFRDPK